MDVEVVIVVTIREEGSESKLAERGIIRSVDDASKALANLGMKVLAKTVKRLER